ncbi:putative metalloprotease CJM1_0395 family protein [Roseibium denhamense]|uniref:putative metalloprotease CJM1_0395 family protein n=1 Tax=Roseibium denhamense TaxID=76305 RepID=UPI001AD8A2C9|nr:putative metalloprotease CJM1_0395 family protein [Roseibium denhamense]
MRDSLASPRTAAISAGSSVPLTSQAVLALQDAEEASGADARRETGESSSRNSGNGQAAPADGNSESVLQNAQQAEEDGDSDGDGLTEAEEEQIQKLAERDREVRAHEQAHARVGGPYASAPSYTFQQGPDGKRYAVGGEVQIDTSTERTPEATIRKMQIVIRAALAPAEPSSQDLQVAQQARAQLSEAQSEARQQAAEELRGNDEDTNSITADPVETAGSEAAAGPANGTDNSSSGNNGPDGAASGGTSDQSAQDQNAAIAAYQSALQRITEQTSGLGSLIT